MTDIKKNDVVTVNPNSLYYRKYHDGVKYYVKKTYNTVCLNGKIIMMAKIISKYEIDNLFGSETIPVSELVKV